MTAPTHEQLLLQILSTCLLINSQGKWHAFFRLSAHVGQAQVRIRPADTAYDAPIGPDHDTQEATFTSTNLFPQQVREDSAQQALIDLLAWTQGYLSKEAAA